MIGWSRSYNCASWAVEQINQHCGTEINVEPGEEWQAKFIPRMRHLFTPVEKPVENCLVVAKTMNNTLHLGIWRHGQVFHNHNPLGGAGCVIGSTMSVMRSEFTKVRFYVANTNNR